MLIHAARGSLCRPQFLRCYFLWVPEQSETSVGEHSTSLAHLAHHIQAKPTGKQKKSKKTKIYSESSGHHHFSYTLLLMAISLKCEPNESILQLWAIVTYITSRYMYFPGLFMHKTGVVRALQKHVSYPTVSGTYPGSYPTPSNKPPGPYDHADMLILSASVVTHSKK